MDGSAAARTTEGATVQLLAAQRASLINVCRLLGMPETATRLGDLPPNVALDIQPRIAREISERSHIIPGNGETTAAFASPFTGLRFARSFPRLKPLTRLS